MKKITKIVLAMTLIILTVVLANVTSSALTFDADMQYQTENMVTLYSKKDYKGKTAEYGIGEYAELDINSDSISVPQEYVVYAYTRKNFKGQEFILNESQSSYLRFEFGRGLTKIFRIKSMKVALIESESVDITELDDAKKNQIMTDYAPRIHMAQSDPYEAVSMDWTFEKFDRIMDGNGDSRVVMKESIDGPFDICETFYGDQDSAVAYGFWVEKDDNFIDFVYFIY